MKNKLKIYLPFSLLILLVLILPLIVMVLASFQSINHPGFNLDNYRQILSNGYYHNAFINSFKIATYSSAISMIVAIAGAWALTKLTDKTKDALITIFNMSSSFAGVPLSFSLIILFGNAGMYKAITTALHINDYFNIYSLSGLVTAYTFFEIPLGIMFLFPVFNGIDGEWSKASSVLGAKRSFYIGHVVIPFVLPNLVQVFILLFANAMGAYETAYALTSNTVVSVPTLIGYCINGEINPNVPLACAFATIFAIIMLVMVKIGNLVTKRHKGGIN